MKTPLFNEDLYIDEVKNDHEMAIFQILDMNYPLDARKIYINVPLYNQKNEIIDSINTLNSNRHCVLLGDLGIGKTMYLHNLVITLAKNSKTYNLLPIFVDLKQFADPLFSTYDLLEYIRNQTNRYLYSCETTIKGIQTKLKSGRVLLLFDSLDATRIGTTQKQAQQTYNYVCRAIEEIAKKYPKTFIIVSYR